MVPDYTKDFDMFKNMLKDHKPFSFVRFSDGEIYIINNVYLELGPDFYKIGTERGPGIYGPEERKLFDPAQELHQEQRRKLIESLQFKQNGYYKGIPIRKDFVGGNREFDRFVRRSGGVYGVLGNQLTFANLWNNANYFRFIHEILPLFQSYEVCMVMNFRATVSGLPFVVHSHWNIGDNCFINGHHTVINAMKDYIITQSTEKLFLISAASLSNIIIHELVQFAPGNTYIDIGSTLNPMMGMNGWQGSRDYLQQYWMHDKQGPQLELKDVWT